MKNLKRNKEMKLTMNNVIKMLKKSNIQITNIYHTPDPQVEDDMIELTNCVAININPFYHAGYITRLDSKNSVHFTEQTESIKELIGMVEYTLLK